MVGMTLSMHVFARHVGGVIIRRMRMHVVSCVRALAHMSHSPRRRKSVEDQRKREQKMEEDSAHHDLACAGCRQDSSAMVDRSLMASLTVTASSLNRLRGSVDAGFGPGPDDTPPG